MDRTLSALKALADANRLKIIALLAQRPRTGDELAALLDLRPSTISHHLTRLQKAGLVRATAEQYYHVYQLESAALDQLSAALAPNALATAIQQRDTIDNDAYRTQILTRWIKGDRLQALPTPIKQRAVILAWLADKFTPDLRYAPRQVDDLLNHWCSWQDSHQLDIVAVTRALVEQKLLDRTRDGRWYWRADSLLAQSDAGFTPEQLPQADTATLHLPLTLSPLRELMKTAMRIKANQPYSVAEIDGLLAKHQKSESDTSQLRSKLVAEGLLKEDASGHYLRPTIGPDHPATVKLRAEALARHEVA